MCVAVICAAEMPSSPELSSSMSHWRSVHALISVSRVAKDLLVTTTSVSAASSCAMARAVSTSSMFARKRIWCACAVRVCSGVRYVRYVRRCACGAHAVRCACGAVRGACAVLCER